MGREDGYKSLSHSNLSGISIYSWECFVHHIYSERAHQQVLTHHWTVGVDLQLKCRPLVFCFLSAYNAHNFCLRCSLISIHICSFSCVLILFILATRRFPISLPFWWQIHHSLGEFDNHPPLTICQSSPCLNC